MAIKPLTIVPNPLLRQISDPVTLDQKTSEIVENLRDTLRAQHHPQGVGLSAPQIGKTKRVFSTWLAEDPNDDPREQDLISYINPVITDHPTTTTFGPDEDEPILEGCLSIPGLYGPVPRYAWIDLTFDTLLPSGEWSSVSRRAEGFLARVIQHELDHLDGRLFIDYSLELDLPVYRFSGKKAIEVDKSLLTLY